LIINIFKSLIAKGWLSVIYLFSVPFLVNHLKPNEYGIYVIIISLIGSSAIMDAGLGYGIVKRVAKIHNDNTKAINILFSNSIFVAFLAFSFVSIAILTYLNFIHLLNIDLAFALILSIVMKFIQIIFESYMIGRHFAGIVSIINAYSTTFRFTLIVFGLVYLDFSLMEVLYIFILGQIMHNMLLMNKLRKIIYFPSFKFSYIQIRYIKPFLSNSAKVFMSNTVSMATVFVDKLIIGAFLPIALLGYYNIAFELASKLWILTGIFSSVLFPVFVILQKSKNQIEIKKVFLFFSKLLILYIGFLVINIYLFSNEILHYWISEAIAKASFVTLKIMLIGIFFSVISVLFINLANSQSKEKEILKIQVFYSFFVIIGAMLVVQNYSIEGVAFIWSVGNVISMFFMLYIIGLKTNFITISEFLKNNIHIFIMLSYIIFGAYLHISNLILLILSSTHIIFYTYMHLKEIKLYLHYKGATK